MRLNAVYGGSFDPIHAGHVSMVRRAVDLGYRVIVVPAFRHAFGKQSAPFEHRVSMCRLALEDPALAHCRVCGVERSLAAHDGQPVYTYDVLSHFKSRLQQPVSLLIGPDIAGEWQRWHRHADIDREFGRLSLPATHAVRSSDIRQQLRLHPPSTSPAAELPAAVARYIAEQGLYH
ncbi:MAG: nicotinate-nicotinamide nucleotide adenylyltransferase [Candidatus Tectomicrobia bacterium]|nr:nicotinate-nicotinamide nucleotide adenylyltransferase [Candidatus Tectomicrobia bacterium]